MRSLSDKHFGMLCLCSAVEVLRLDSHPDHNKEPVSCAAPVLRPFPFTDSRFEFLRFTQKKVNS